MPGKQAAGEIAPEAKTAPRRKSAAERKNGPDAKIALEGNIPSERKTAPAPQGDPAGGISNWLHLFTGNLRRLYLQDALNVLATPFGHRTRFRYEPGHRPNSHRDGWKTHATRQVHRTV